MKSWTVFYWEEAPEQSRPRWNKVILGVVEADTAREAITKAEEAYDYQERIGYTLLAESSMEVAL